MRIPLYWLRNKVWQEKYNISFFGTVNFSGPSWILSILFNFLTFLKFNVDHSERAFYKELVKVIEASDVILEVLDARDPLGSRCIDMENMVMKAGPEKHLVLLLNKIGMKILSLLFCELISIFKVKVLIVELNPIMYFWSRLNLINLRIMWE